VTRRVVRLTSADQPLLDVFSAARLGPPERLSTPQIEQIRRIVRRVPEVMVKVTGGGRSVRAVAAHIDYIGHPGEIELESDRGERIREEAQEEFLRTWHLEVSTGQYRSKLPARSVASGIKLVHNVVLAMPAGTPPDKVLYAARAFAREKFNAHRYLLALHTHQRHPHVHLVVKAEREIEPGRLHIDKAMLREWRQDFARMMREQGIAADATSRAVRGQTKRASKDVFYRTRQRGQSYALRTELDGVARELSRTKTISDPARAQLLKTRKAVIAGWNAVAAKLEAQGEIALGGDVRCFVNNLPPVLTDQERLAAHLIQIVNARKAERAHKEDNVRDRALDRSR
jgi:Relaxase/Mobilisation nuclease domain